MMERRYPYPVGNEKVKWTSADRLDPYRYLGYPDVRTYEGAFNDWVSHPEIPP